MKTKVLAVSLMVGTMVSLAGASITYDNVYRDFGTDPGKVQTTEDFVNLTNVTASYTTNSIILSKTESSTSASFAFRPSGFSWNAGSSTIDMRIKRLGTTDANTHWDVVVHPAWTDWNKGQAWYLVLVSNDETTPVLTDTNSVYHTYRWTMTDAWDPNAMYVDDNPTPETVGVTWNQYDFGQINFDLDARSGLTGVEIDFIGVANSAYASPPVPEPVTLGLLSLGLLMLRRCK